ncbi:MAG TPA: hypothetical protein VFR44_14560 [Actinomycetota bacterium]|nr:hypothetical protein [Actinomycetota bacterium]
MVPTIQTLLERLDEAGIRACHWKSNWALDQTLEGATDIDLLIHRQDAGRFRDLLTELRFEPSIEAGVPTIPSTEHHIALDEATGTLVHVHAYFRVITGESLAKNYRLPIEEMLLANTRREGIVPVPSRGAELIVFVLRMMVKHTTAIELTLLARQTRQLRGEIEWLVTDEAVDEAEKLLPVWLPQIDERLFRQAVDALRRPAPAWRRVTLGYRVRHRLRTYARRPALKARAVEASKFAGVVSHRLTGSSKKLTPGGGGGVIAFVGSEATGKSTIIDRMHRWLGENYTVRRIHAGKPPATPLTYVPHVLLPWLRRLFPDQRSTRVERQTRDPELAPGRTYPLMFGVRSVMLAYERRALLTHAFALSANGTIVLCDRYPSSRSGAPDGPQLGHLSAPDPLRRWLTAFETRWYDDVPAPDLVVHLTAPLDVTLARNAARDKTEPEDYVRFRHSLSSDLEFDGVPVHRVATDRQLEDVVREVKDAIWEAL